MFKDGRKLTFNFVPRSTVFRSRSSTSFCRIFFTRSASAVSGTYFLFDGVNVVGPANDGSAVVEAGGVPGGVPRIDC